MASFYAELHLAGNTYPVRACTYEFTQATGERGRVVAKVRHGRIRLLLDVPDDDFLLACAVAPNKPLDGRVVFFDTQGGRAVETLSWEAGHCVEYFEEFLQGSTTHGAYVCRLAIVAPKLTVRAGGPGGYARPAPGTHGAPQQALLNPLLVPLLTPTPVVVPVAEAVAEATLTAALAPLALVLALILGTATRAGGPGIAQPHGLPVDPNVLRLHELAARHAAGTLAPGEEAELIALLAKVRGIHVQKLSDLLVEAPLRGSLIALPGFYNISLPYTKRPEADLVGLRNKFNSSARKNFLKNIGTEPHAVAQLKQAGFSDADITEIAKGIQPIDYQVHHKLPLDDGGDNAFDNLVLIKNDPYHKSLTNLQNTATRGLQAGQIRLIQWPVCPGIVYPTN